MAWVRSEHAAGVVSWFGFIRRVDVPATLCSLILGRFVMACPTCDHTMQSVGDGVFWCPRCGSIRTVRLESIRTVRLETEPCVPKLVERIRSLLPLIEETTEVVRLGIRESVGRSVLASNRLKPGRNCDG